MIEKIRKPKKSRNFATYVITTIIFGMIVATFIFMIPGMGGPSGSANSAAEIGSSRVSLREYNDQLRMVRSQYQKMFNGEIPAFFEANLKGQVLESLVQSEVMRQFAKEQGVVVSDLEVADFLKKEIPAFQEDGLFSIGRYNSYLESARLTPAKFEKRVYNDLLRQKLQNAFTLAFEKTDLEETLKEEGENVKLKFKYIKYDPSLVKSAVTVDNTQVSDFVSTTEGLSEVKSFFEDNKSRYSSEKEVRLSYILLDSEEQAKAVLAELSPENFADVAKEKSTESLTKASGGDVGFIKRGDFEESIEEQVFKMELNQISDPIKTEKGFALATVTEIKDESVADFESIKNEVAKDFLKDKALKLAEEKIKELNKEGGSEELAKTLINSGHTWSKTLEFGLTEQQVPEIGDASELFPKLLELTPGQSSSKLAFVGSDRYLFMNEGFVESEVKADESSVKPAGPNSSSRGQEAYYQVYQSEKEKLNVVTNSQLIAE